MLSGISIIVPAFNEAPNMEDAVRQILAGMPSMVKSFELIIVDDGSTDSTGGIIRGLAGCDNRIRAVCHERNEGKGAAWASGLRQASMQWVLFMDADLQIDISELPPFLSMAGEYDAVIGYRAGRRDSVFRRLFSKAYGLLVLFFLGFRVKDINCPFKLIRKGMLTDIELRSRGFLIDAEIIYRIRKKGNRIKELAVVCHPRSKGRSKVGFHHAGETLRELFFLLREKDG